jgi:hypothetical protein
LHRDDFFQLLDLILNLLGEFGQFPLGFFRLPEMSLFAGGFVLKGRRIWPATAREAEG